MYRIILPTLFGLEALVKTEVLEAGAEPDNIVTEDGQVSVLFTDLGDCAAFCARMNFRSRCAERVLMELASWRAESFDELFDGCMAVPWEDYVDEGMEIRVKGYSRKSKLFGVPSCQKILKKAIVKRLSEARGISGDRLPEDRKKGIFQLQFSIVDDVCGISLDTSGDGLHKRGYRPLKTEAPLKETLAAAMLQLSFWERNAEVGEVLLDPCCGSGTFAIEAAMILAGIAPGLKRHFAGEKHRLMGQAVFDREREYAKLLLKEKVPGKIFARDIDPATVAIAKVNAERAGVLPMIEFKRADLFTYKPDKLKKELHSERILVIANPPYGERIMDEKEAGKILEALGCLCIENDSLREGYRLSLLSPDPEAEKKLGKVADKRRKLYNGMILCHFLHYFRRSGDTNKAVYS